MTAEDRVLHTEDGEVCEAQYAAATGHARAGVVLCHPHPQYGGTMRSLVISALFEALPAAGYSVLRFNFRGVERSTGEHGGRPREPADVLAALEELAATVPALPLALVGWSFGADMALSVADERVAGWVAIVPPLRFHSDFAPVAMSPRPKHLVLAQHDEFRAPDEVVAEVADWSHTTTEVVSGASHFFVGRTDRVIAATDEFLAALGS